MLFRSQPLCPQSKVFQAGNLLIRAEPQPLPDERVATTLDSEVLFVIIHCLAAWKYELKLTSAQILFDKLHDDELFLNIPVSGRLDFLD